MSAHIHTPTYCHTPSALAVKGVCFMSYNPALACIDLVFTCMLCDLFFLMWILLSIHFLNLETRFYTQPTLLSGIHSEHLIMAARRSLLEWEEVRDRDSDLTDVTLASFLDRND